ncbi:MAG TPA: c-type cytochrome [Pseudacidobacterium sp.]|jgi:mono/diheme cytochrome c family protein|nr:c-type cytochrome [Pseudacidobacterium sp.]
MKRLHIATLLAAVLGFIPAATCAAAPQTSATDTPQIAGAQAYAKHCAICHGDKREGNLPAFPPLLDVDRQLSDQQITALIHTGKGRMPAFPHLQHEELTALLRFLATDDLSASAHSSSNSLAETGGHIFQRNCAFCHGRDAAGGETGPDLTRSKLVRADVSGDKIAEVVRNGRPDKKMPAFNFSSEEIHSIAAFIHREQAQALSRPGGRRGVDVTDLQTGNAEAGRLYFNGAGTCSKCHSPTGDLAGIASRLEGLQLEQQMLYPRDAKSHVTVTLPSGEKITGVLAYRDEFTIGLRDVNSIYHSWDVTRVRYTVDAPVDAHVELFSKYTDADIHNLMAYLQTLR